MHILTEINIPYNYHKNPFRITGRITSFLSA